MRFNDLQGESRCSSRIEGVAALLQNAHAYCGGDPMCRSDNPEGTAYLGPSRKIWHRESPQRRIMLVQEVLSVKPGIPLIAKSFASPIYFAYRTLFGRPEVNACANEHDVASRGAG